MASNSSAQILDCGERVPPRAIRESATRRRRDGPATVEGLRARRHEVWALQQLDRQSGHAGRPGDFREYPAT